MKLRSQSRLFAKLIRRRLYSGIGTTGICLAAAGCSRGPTPVELPNFDPEGSASKAMEIYDTDGDGYVAGKELEKAPGLKAALKNLDTNGDSKVSAEEVAARVEKWSSAKIGLMNFTCKVLLDGKPMPDGTITYVPEEFLGGVTREATSEIMYGDADPLIPKDKRPTPDTPPGVQAGIYKVKVSRVVDGKETIPARYNSETILGHEVARDDPMLMNHRVVFKVESR